MQPQAHPVSRQHLGSVLVLDLDDAGRLDPGFSIYLHRDALIPPDSDLHHAALWGEQPRVGIMVGSVLLPSAAVQGLKRFPMPCQCQPGAQLSAPKAVWHHQIHTGSLASTCAMRWCWRLMTRDMAIWMLPKTATTSSFLSSNDGAPKFCGGSVQVRPPNQAHFGTQSFTTRVPKAGTTQIPAQGLTGSLGPREGCCGPPPHTMVLALTLSSLVPPQKLMPPA